MCSLGRRELLLHSLTLHVLGSLTLHVFWQQSAAKLKAVSFCAEDGPIYILVIVQGFVTPFGFFLASIKLCLLKIHRDPRIRETAQNTMLSECSLYL